MQRLSRQPLHSDQHGQEGQERQEEGQKEEGQEVRHGTHQDEVLRVQEEGHHLHREESGCGRMALLLWAELPWVS